MAKRETQEKKLTIMEQVESAQLKTNIPDFRPGDNLRVTVKIKEGDKERLQAFEGICIRIQNAGVRMSFTVRKISYGIGVERIFPIHSPMIDKIEVVRRGSVRRARLYYLRELKGKAARVKVHKTAQ